MEDAVLVADKDFANPSRLRRTLDQQTQVSRVAGDVERDSRMVRFARSQLLRHRNARLSNDLKDSAPGEGW
jgi:hypothetical protein